jgi:hypothetical protein
MMREPVREPRASYPTASVSACVAYVLKEALTRPSARARRLPGACHLQVGTQFTGFTSTKVLTLQAQAPSTGKSDICRRSASEIASEIVKSISPDRQLDLQITRSISRSLTRSPDRQLDLQIANSISPAPISASEIQ